MILVGYPIIAAISAVYASNRDFVEFCRLFQEQLVQPQDWFSFWRLNCRLATSHAYMTNNKWKNEYDVEDKWGHIDSLLLGFDQKRPFVFNIILILPFVIGHVCMRSGKAAIQTPKRKPILRLNKLLLK